MTASSDIRYGRQAGRIIPPRLNGEPFDDYGACELCGRPMVVGPAGGQHGAHVVCRDAANARKRVAT